MRKLAGTITPCQSKAAAMRLMRSPPAAKNVATTSTSHERAQREGIAQRQPRHRRPGLERAAARSAARHGRATARATTDRSVGADLVGDRGRRPMRQAGVAIEPPQPVHPARQAQHQERPNAAAASRKNRTNRPIAPVRSAAARATARARTGQEQADHGRERRQRRPQPFPEDRPARPAQRPRQHAGSRAVRACGAARGRSARPEDRSVKYISRNRIRRLPS